MNAHPARSIKSARLLQPNSDDKLGLKWAPRATCAHKYYIPISQVFIVIVYTFIPLTTQPRNSKL